MAQNNPFSFTNLVKPFANLASPTPKNNQPFKFPTPGIPTPGQSSIPLGPSAPNMSTVNGPVRAPAPVPFTANRTVPQVTGPTPSAPRPTTPTAPVAPATPTQQPTTTKTFTTPSGLVVDEFGNPQGGAAGSTPESTSGASTPTKPNIQPETEKAVKSAEDAIVQASKITPEELATQEDLDKLQESTKKAFQNTSDQPIPLEFITGQLKSIENRALNLAEPLETKLARLQAKRTSALSTSKFSLERADKKAADEKATASAKKDTDTFVDQSGNTILYDTQTGLAISNLGKGPTQGDDFTLGKDQIRFDAEGNVIAQGSSAGAGGGVGAGIVGGPVSAHAQQLADLISSGSAKLSDIEDDNLKQEVMNAMATGTASGRQQEVESLNEKINQLNTIENHPGLNSRVGPNPFARIDPTDAFGQGQDFAAEVHKIAGRLALDELIAVKGRGATFGALQKAELDLLIQSASKIGDWELKNKQGEGIGKWDIDEASFKRELGTIKRLTEKAIGFKGGEVAVKTIENPDDAASFSIGQEFTLNGARYKKTGDDAFEEIK